MEYLLRHISSCYNKEQAGLPPRQLMLYCYTHDACVVLLSLVMKWLPAMQS